MPGKKRRPKIPKPISLYPLTPEQALYAFMKIDPERIKAAERRTKKRRNKIRPALSSA